jgi:hypothetical protein
LNLKMAAGRHDFLLRFPFQFLQRRRRSLRVFGMRSMGDFTVMPERFAQEALGHNSKAVHRAYAKRALMKIPSLEDYEK